MKVIPQQPNRLSAKIPGRVNYPELQRPRDVGHHVNTHFFRDRSSCFAIACLFLVKEKISIKVTSMARNVNNLKDDGPKY